VTGLDACLWQSECSIFKQPIDDRLGVGHEKRFDVLFLVESWHNCSPFNDCRNDAFKLQYTGSPIVSKNLFDVELISIPINKMGNRKAAELGNRVT